MIGLSISPMLPRVFARTRELASSQCDRVLPVHLARASLQLEGSGATTVLLAAGFDPAVLEQALASEAVPSPKRAVPPERIAFSAAAKAHIEAAMRASRRLGQDYLGTEHLLLGFLAMGERRGRILRIFGRQRPADAAAQRLCARVDRLKLEHAVAELCPEEAIAQAS